MGIISTKELFERYFSESDVVGTSMVSLKKIINKPSLYEYEEKINKEFIDMNEDELTELIAIVLNKRDNIIGGSISHVSVASLVCLIKNIFDYYIENYQIIRNPMHKKEMKAFEVIKRINKDVEPLTWDYVQDLIDKIHKNEEELRACYFELLILMFYNGFAKPEELVTLKEDMINHRNQTVRLSGRTIQLSNRCYNLLVKFNEIDTLPGWRGDYLMMSWNGGYFKFIIRPNKELEFNNRPIEIVCNLINHQIAKGINDKYGVKINYFNLFLLGFYDHIVKTIGEEKVHQIIEPTRSGENTALLMRLASEYGVFIENSSALRKYLMPFIKNSVD